MKSMNLRQSRWSAAGMAAVALGVGACSVTEDAPDSLSAKHQAIGPVVPRQHHEFIDSDGLFVTYWERYYEADPVNGPFNAGTATMTTGVGSYRTDVDYSLVNPDLDGDGNRDISHPNSVSGKGKAQCWGDTINWTTVAAVGVTSLRVYGWFESPLVEYYIGRGSQLGTGPGDDPNDLERLVGTYGPTGDRWELWVSRLAQENILNPEKDPNLPLRFFQYNIKALNGQSTDAGPIDLSTHFAGWESLMQAYWNDPANDAWFGKGTANVWTWNPLTRANYCVVAAELWGAGNVGYAEIENITVTENFPQMVDGSCNGVDNDGNGTADEDWVSGFCKLPEGHPTCEGVHGTTECSGGTETCKPNVAGTIDECDGQDNDCDGVIDEDPVPEIACNGKDDDCDGSVDEGSINLPIRCVHDQDEDGIEDGLDLEPDTYSDEFAEDDFGRTSGEIVDRGDQTVVVLDPLGDEGVWLETLPTGGATEAVISLCEGTVTVTMGPGESQVVTCPETSCLFASQQLTFRDRAEAWSDFYAGNFSLQSGAKVYGNGLSTGSGNLSGGAGISGTARVAGALTGNVAGIGTPIQGATVAAQKLTEFPIVVSGANDTVLGGTTRTIAPGDYGDIEVRDGARLALSSAGTYRFNSLNFIPDATLDLTAVGAGHVVIAVEGNVNLGDRLVLLGNAELDIYANGTSFVVGYDIVAFAADIQAPFADVIVNDRTRLNGCLGGRNVTIGFEVDLTGISTMPPPPPTPVPLTFWQTKTGDWGGDYCIQVGAHNPGTTAVNWIITINTNGSTIYNTWNAAFSGTMGTVTADPNQSYNLVIDPGETDTSVGFCAHRNAPGQTATVVSAAVQ